MKFYNRTSELAELQRIQNLSFSDYSRLTVVTGRRRIGKTSLIMKSIEGLSTVYLFVGRKSEATLCSEFIPIISQSLDHPRFLLYRQTRLLFLSLTWQIVYLIAPVFSVHPYFTF